MNHAPLRQVCPAIIQRAAAADVPFAWVPADSIYGVGDIEMALRHAVYEVRGQIRLTRRSGQRLPTLGWPSFGPLMSDRRLAEPVKFAHIGRSAAAQIHINQSR